MSSEPFQKTRSLKTGMKKSFRIILAYTFAFLIFFAFFKFFLQGKELFQRIRDIDTIYFVPQLILAFCFGLVTAYMNSVILKAFSVNLKFKEWFGLGCVNTLSNYLFPLKSGTLIKAVYLRNKYDFSISQSFAILFFATFISFELNFLLTALLLTYIKMKSFSQSSYLDLFMLLSYSIFFMGIVSILILSRVNVTIKIRNAFIDSIINKFILFMDGMKLMSRNYRLLITIIISSMTLFFIQILRFYFAYLAIAIPSTLFEVTFINLLSSIVDLVSLTPGNLGIQEVVISLSSKAVGFTTEEGFVAAAIIRIAAMSLFFSFGIVSSIMLKKGLSS